MKQEQYFSLRKELGLKNQDTHLWRTLTLHFAIAYGAFVLATQNSVLANLLAFPLLTVLMIRSFALMHEASHKAISKNTVFNEVVGEICGAICQLPLIPWKKSHLQHHKWSGNIQHDPVMGFLVVYPKLSAPSKKILTTLWNSWIPVLAFVQQTVFWSLSIRVTLQRFQLRTFVSLSLPLLFWGFIFSQAPAQTLLCTVLPAIFLYYISVEAINFPHHLQIQTLEGETQLPAREQYQTARTCLYPKWLSQYIALNFNFHIEHHLYPDISWRELPKIHAQIQKENLPIHQDDSFSWILKNRSRSLDDVFYHESQKNQNLAA